MAQIKSYSNRVMVGRLSLFFPVPAENSDGEYLLRELEFEELESPEYYMRERRGELTGPLLQ